MKKVWYYLLWAMMVSFVAPAIMGLVDILSWFWTGWQFSDIHWTSLRILMAGMFMILSASCLVMLDEHYWSKRK